MELAEPADEAVVGAGDEAAPLLADEGGAGEARGVVGRQAEESVLHEILRQRRHRHAHAARSITAWCGQV